MGVIKGWYSKGQRVADEEWWRIGAMLEEEWDKQMADAAKLQGEPLPPELVGVSERGRKTLSVPPYRTKEALGSLGWTTFIGSLIFPAKLISTVWAQAQMAPKEEDVGVSAVGSSSSGGDGSSGSSGGGGAVGTGTAAKEE